MVNYWLDILSDCNKNLICQKTSKILHNTEYTLGLTPFLLFIPQPHLLEAEVSGKLYHSIMWTLLFEVLGLTSFNHVSKLQ